MKCHKWTTEHERLLFEAIEVCGPLFEHFKKQGKSYSDMNAWDAIAGRLLPDICVTGAACKRRFEQTKSMKNDSWKVVIDAVENYERDLAETTFDGVAELLAGVDTLIDAVMKIQKDIENLKKAWD